MMNILYYIILFMIGSQDDSAHLLLKEINLIRAHGCHCGDVIMPAADSLIWNQDLAHTARQHAQDMQDNNYFSHFNHINQDVSFRADSILYEWNQIGENIAMGFLSDFEVMRAWLDSPEHCEMIMYPIITEMGASRVGEYWVVNFGKPLTPTKKSMLSKVTRRRQ